MMHNIKVQRLKCYHNKKIKTEQLRNTNMLDKCRNITLEENRRQNSTLSLIDVSSLRNSDWRRWAPEMPLQKTYRSTTASTEIFEMLKTISLRAHWYRRTQKRALRPHGELFRPSVKENCATKRISVVLWNKHVCKNFSDILYISSNTGMQLGLHKSGSRWQCVLYGGVIRLWWCLWSSIIWLLMWCSIKKKLTKM